MSTTRWWPRSSTPAAHTAPAGHTTSSPTETTGGAPRRHGRFRRVAGRLVATISTLIVVAILALAVALTLAPAVAGGHTLTVLSGSMTPRLPVGSVVVDKPVEASSLRAGDIVTYAGDDGLVTHRIVRVKQGSAGPVFTTKGDANNTADTEPVDASQIRGELWYHIPYVGTVRDFLISTGGLLAVGGAVTLGAAVWFIVRLNRPSRADGKAGTT